jgi:hypothetical protein
LFGVIRKKIEEHKSKIAMEEAIKEEERKAKEEIRRAKELEEQNILNKELDKYLSTVHPTFLLVPEVKKALYQILHARSYGTNLEVTLTEELFETLMSFYNQELNIFLKLLENKGYTLKGREKEFVDSMISKIEEINYLTHLNKYGDFVDENDNLKAACYKFFELSGADNIYDAGVLSFILRYFYNKGVTSEEYNVWKFSEKLEEYFKVYEVEMQVLRMEKRLENSSAPTTFTIDSIDNMTGVEFEVFLMDLFSKIGYRVEQTKSTGDQGVDILAYKKDECIAVQAKCYASTVGNSAIQEVVAGIRFYNADKGYVVTNNYFTAAAKELANINGITLWDRDKLSDLINLLY